MLLADTLNISPGGKTPMFFPERQPAGLALCSGCFITFSWWCCEWILMPVVTHQQNAAGKYWARLQEGKTDVSEMRGQTLCYSVLLPVALYSTAWTVDLSCLSQTNSLPQFSSCLHDLYVSQCFLVEIEGSFRLGYGLFFVGGGFVAFLCHVMTNSSQVSTNGRSRHLQNPWKLKRYCASTEKNLQSFP